MWELRQPQKTGKLDYHQRDNVEHEGDDGVHSNFHGELNIRGCGCFLGPF